MTDSESVRQAPSTKPVLSLPKCSGQALGLKAQACPEGRGDKFEALVHEAVEIKYVIFEAGGMATKSVVEDVLMLRHPGLDRHEAHDVLNRVEFLNLKIRKPYACEANTDRPTLADYPEIGQVEVPYLNRRK